MLLSNKAVLVVEDEFLIAALLEGMIEDLGCTDVTTAGTLEKALDVIGRYRFDLVILDVNLDGKPSAPVADILVEKKLPFIFSTGYDTAALAERWSAYPFLQKPFAATSLEEAIKRILV